MICTNLSGLLGFQCHPLSEDGQVAYIESAFSFEDGAEIPIFVEQLGDQIRFFDDGEVLFHLRGRGVLLEDKKNARFLRKLVEPSNVKLNDSGEIEIWSKPSEAPTAFANYIAAMTSIMKWEIDQIGVGTDLSLLISDVAFCLRAIKPQAKIEDEPEYIGISGHRYKLDLKWDDQAVVAISTHHAAVGAAAKKLLDIRGSNENSGLKILVVIDDRANEEAAKSEGRILDSVANVWMMSRLEQEARKRNSSSFNS